MKTKKRLFKNTLLLAMLFMFTTSVSFAQDALIYVEQYWVKPSKTNEFMTARKSILNEFEKHKFPYSSSFSFLSDGSSISLSRIKSFADLDNNPYKEFSEKVGVAKFSKMSEDHDKCLDNITRFILHYKDDLSYRPKGETFEGHDFARIYFLYINPGEGKKVYDKIKSIKDSFTKKGAIANFIIYRSGIGTPNEYYAVVLSGKDEAHVSKMYEDNDKIVGEDVNKSIDELFMMASKKEILYSWSNDNLSYKVKK